MANQTALKRETRQIYIYHRFEVIFCCLNGKLSLIEHRAPSFQEEQGFCQMLLYLGILHAAKKKMLSKMPIAEFSPYCRVLVFISLLRACKKMPGKMPIADLYAYCQVFMPSKNSRLRMPRNTGQWTKSLFFQH